MNRITPLFVTLVLLVSAAAPVAAVEMTGGDFGICMVGVPSACNGDDFDGDQDSNEVTDRLDRMLGEKGIATSTSSGSSADTTTTTSSDGQTTTTVTETSSGTTTTVTTHTRTETETSTHVTVSTRTTSTSSSDPAAGDAASDDASSDADDEPQSLLDRVTNMPDGLSGAEKLECLRNGCDSGEESGGSSTSTQTQTQTQYQSQTST